MAETLAASEVTSTGLTQVQAKQRLAQFGPSEPAPTKRTAPLFQLLILLANPLAIILLVASVISAALGEVINASIIPMVLFSVALNFIQHIAHKKQSTVSALE
jgi:magnesium-transporting ATPase (P-type)